MKGRYFRHRSFWLLVGCATLILPLRPTSAQNPPPQANSAVQSAEKENNEEERRRMFRTFSQRRQAANRTLPPRNSSAVKSPNSGADKTVNDALIGLTVWEMRESASGAERRSFTLKKANGQNVNMRPFRLGSGSALVAGRSYVFSIESARTGYLYVIDRELYTKGAIGTPLLLFPTKDVRGGIFKVTAGDVVEIPDQKNETAYFEATKHGPDHIGEALTIIISPEPLVSTSRLEVEPITLNTDEFEKWQKLWATRTRWAENATATGQAYTEAEGKAGGDPVYKLKEGDPLPQRVYELAAKQDTPLLLTVVLRYANSPN
jgi:hypothetical protein